MAEKRGAETDKSWQPGYTVTRTTQNEALLWKIAVLGMKKVPCGCRNILPLAHTGTLQSSMMQISSGP